MELEFLQAKAREQLAQALKKGGIPAELQAALEQILQENFQAWNQAHQQECDSLRALIEGKAGDLIGNSNSMHEVERQVRQIANSDAVVLIRGAAGTGKEHTAKNIHSISERSEKPFIILNCDSLNEREGFNSFESELFGYERGAFVGATSRRLGKAELAIEKAFRAL